MHMLFKNIASVVFLYFSCDAGGIGLFYETDERCSPWRMDHQDGLDFPHNSATRTKLVPQTQTESFGSNMETYSARKNEECYFLHNKYTNSLSIEVFTLSFWSTFFCLERGSWFFLHFLWLICCYCLLSYKILTMPLHYPPHVFESELEQFLPDPVKKDQTWMMLLFLPSTYNLNNQLTASPLLCCSLNKKKNNAQRSLICQGIIVDTKLI